MKILAATKTDPKVWSILIDLQIVYNLAIVGCPIDFPFFAESMNLVEVVNLDLAVGQVSTWIGALKRKILAGNVPD